MKILKSDLSIRRWNLFKSRKTAVVASTIFGLMCIFSATSEFWANSKPLVMKYNGQIYFPVLKYYAPKDFGVTDRLQMNYRSMDLSSDENWAIWPIIKWDPYESNKTVTRYPAPPSSDNLMGTDQNGRDVLTRILYGFRYSISYAVLAWFFSLVIAVLIGGSMGFFGSWFDLIGQRVVEVMNSIPVLFILLILSSIFRPNLFWLVMITTTFGWIFMSYYIRAEFLRLRRQSFVEVGRALGAKDWRLILKHILPNSLTPVITFSPFIIANHVNGLAALDYLGFGLRPPTPSWGELLQQAKNNFMIGSWLAIYPSLALFITLLLLGLIGDGVRVAFDPKKTPK